MGQVPEDAWFRQRAEASGDVFFISRILPDVYLEFISANIVDQAGHTAQSLMNDVGLFGAVDDHALLQMQPGEERTVEVTWEHLGELRWSQVTAVCTQREDGSVVVEGVSRDITDLRQMQSALRDSEELYRLLAENAWDVIWTMGLDGAVTYVSPSVERVRGITPAEAAAQTIDQVHTPSSQASVLQYYQRLFAAMAAGEELPTFRGEHEYYRKDGSIMIGELQVIPQVDESGRPVQILGVTRDISERKQWEADLATLAVTDPLTGVYNRRHGEVLMTAALDTGDTVSLLMIDLDHFKTINDTRGHRAGDEALITFSKNVREVLHSGDIFARWGGEEFVVMMTGGPDTAIERAESIRGGVERWGELTVSIGIASGAGRTLDWLLTTSDRALYQAKSDGRNCVRVATEPLPPQCPA